MIRHIDPGTSLFSRTRHLKQLLDNGEIRLAGNSKLKIYGTLTCASGKRMKQENRVFFADEAEAMGLGYRPCGNCMRQAYRQWKALN